MQVDIEVDELKQVVKRALDDHNFEITFWEPRLMGGGTVGIIYLINGEGKSSTITGVQSSVKWSVVLKILKQWNRFGDPESWKREMLMYQSNLFDHLPEYARVPKCLDIRVHADDEIWLWMESVQGRSGDVLQPNDYALVARHLGQFQGRFSAARNIAMWGTEAVPFLEKNRLHRVITEDMLRIWNERDKYLHELHCLPLTLCHRDLTPSNILIQNDEGKHRTVFIDWDCTGIGTIGEDIADLLAEALVFYGYDVSQAEELEKTLLSSYFTGLQASGWNGTLEQIKLAYQICLMLNWCFRIVCQNHNTDNKDIRKRNAEILRFMLDRKVKH